MSVTLARIMHRGAFIQVWWPMAQVSTPMVSMLQRQVLKRLVLVLSPWNMHAPTVHVYPKRARNPHQGLNLDYITVHLLLVFAVAFCFC